MICRVHLFARARDLAGTNAVALDLPAGSRVADLKAQLGREHPALKNLLERSAIAVNDDYAEDNSVIEDGADVALIPPVSGG